MFIGLYWGNRKASRDECVAQTKEALDRLSQFGDEFAVWYKKGKTRKTASEKTVALTCQGIEDLIRTNNRDTESIAIPELGFNVSIWNGRDSFPCSLCVTCGSHSEYVKNCVVLELPQAEFVKARFSDQTIRQMLIELVRVFDPDTALVTSNEFIDSRGGGAPWEAGGWLVYNRGGNLDTVVECGAVGVVS